jgi:hypothetical protein
MSRYWIHAAFHGGLSAFNIWNGAVNGNKWSLILALPITGVLFIMCLVRAIVETAARAKAAAAKDV